MLLEEWRAHTTAFGELRFAVFPVQIFLFTALATGLLTLTEITPGTVLLGIHIIVLLFGLHTGTTAFEGSDALENVLGDVTYLLFSTRTLPVSPRELFGIFIIKDVVYYSTLFIIPITLGTAPLYYYTSLSFGLVSAMLTVGTLTGMFILGTAVSVIAARSTAFGVPGVFVATVAVGAVIITLTFDLYPVHTLTPFGLHAAESWITVIHAIVPTVVAVTVAVGLYAPTPRTQHQSASESQSSLYRRFQQSTDDVATAIAGKTIFDIHRSSGGFLKVGVSAAILFATAVFMVWGVESTLHIPVNAGIVFGTLLSLTAFTTYTWITQYDDPGEYVFHPVSIPAVFKAKYVAFAVVTVPTGVIFYGAVVLYQSPALLDAVAGGVIFSAGSVFVLGLVVYLAGLDPNMFMFDTKAFTTFGVAVIVGIVPLVLFSFFGPLQASTFAGILIWSGVLLAVGGAACWVAPGKWRHRYRSQ